jgi:hypothetical protein
MPMTSQEIITPSGIRVVARGQMRALRLRSSQLAAETLTQEQAHEQMRRNGSVSSPNPYYLGPENRGGSLTRLSAQS